MIHHTDTLKINITKLSLYVLLIINAGGSLHAAGTDQLFLSDEPLKLELRADFSAVQADRTGTPEYHDGVLVYYSSNGKSEEFSVKVMARGNFRLNPENCKFPPLFVNFKKSEVPNSIFDNQDKLKLVTPCQTDDYVLKEYLIYKMYNQVTDVSLKVRLAKILYYDTGSKKVLFERYSFFIEDKDHLGERIDSFEKGKPVPPYDLNMEHFMKMPVFQYIIGQKDWYITTTHNVLIMQPNDTTLAPYVIPYDFDFSALVNAEYTWQEGMPDNTQHSRRIYRGLCYNDAEFEEIFDFYRKLRPGFESIINGMDLLPKAERKRMIKYISYFYDVINNEDLIKQEFISNCLTRADYGMVEK